MSSTRREAILSKVLTRLYPAQVSNVKKTNEPSKNGTCDKEGGVARGNRSEVVEASAPSASGSDMVPLNPTQNEGNRSVDAGFNLKHNTEPVHNAKEWAQQKIYTVSLPPDNYVPDNQHSAKSSSTEASDEDVEDELCGKRRKRRRRRKKADAKPQSYPDSKHNLQQTEHQPLKHEGEPINKNKRRKLQRKRQKERLQAAGLWPKLKTADLTNQSDKERMGNDAMEQSHMQTLKEEKTTEDLLDFLQATQEIYFTEGKSTSADFAPSIELVQEILNQIKNGGLPFSEICLLHHLRSLLLLQDIERLKESLGSFKEHSSLPLGIGNIRRG